MMCLKDLLLYMLLLPIPSASPLFIGLYWLAVILAIRPCGYCIALFAVINLSTSPSSPFLEVHPPQLPIDPLRPLTSPLPDRTWLTWNEGRWWDPAIMGYREIANLYNPTENTTTMADLEDVPSETGQGGATASVRVKEDLQAKLAPIWDRIPWKRSAITTSTSMAALALSTPTPSADTLPTPTDISVLPAKYLDLRWRGMGFILDVGFTRSEEGLGWELADAKRAVQAEKEARDAYRDRLRELGPDASSDQEQDGRVNDPDEQSIETPCQVSGEIESRQPPRRWLDRVSVLGSW